MAKPSEKQQLELPVAISPAGVQGRSGLRRAAGRIQDEFLTQLRGSRGQRVYREMADNEIIVAAWLFVVEVLLRQTETRIEASGKTPQHIEQRDFVQSCLDDLLEDNGWGGFMAEYLSCLVFGWSWHEKLYKFRRGLGAPVPWMRSKHNDGRIGWRKFPLRAQDTLLEWIFDEQTDDVLGWWQLPPNKSKRLKLTRDRALHFRVRGTQGNPEGKSLLRHLYTSWYFAKHMRFVEAVGVERDLAGYPVMQVPISVFTNSSKLAEWQNFIRDLKRDEQEGAVIPPETDEQGNSTGYKLSLLSSGGRRPADADSVIKRYESRMAMGLMIQFLLLGQDKVGSYALVDNNTDLFSVGLGTILDVRDGEFTDNAIPELVAVNGYDPQYAPTMSHGDIEAPDPQKLAALLSAALGTGAVTRDAKLESHIREILGWPQADPLTAPAPSLAPMAPDAIQGETI